jgi:hypothetical protein
MANAPKTSQSHSENTSLSLKTLIVASRDPTMVGLPWWAPKRLTIGGLFLIHLGFFGDIAATSTWSASVQSRLSSTYTSMCTKAMIALLWSLASLRMRSSSILMHAMSLHVKGFGASLSP